MNTCEISKALDDVALLTRAIELSATRYADGNTSTAIDTLHDVIINQEDNPESRGNANEAREVLRALQDAAGLLLPASGTRDANEATATAGGQ
jgi:hypothetical protein